MYPSFALAEIPETGERVGTGWLPELPDLRDRTDADAEFPEMMKSLGIPATLSAFPASVDLRQWCSPIENQGRLGSCTAHAGAGVVEYFQRRAFGRYIDSSRLFIYKTTRNLMGVVGDTGAWLRFTMGALRLCGAPPEKYWPYTDRKQPGPGGERTFDEEPPSFVYSVGEDYEAVRYFRHDPRGRNPQEVLDSTRKYLSAGIPCMFGFYGFPSANSADVLGAFPFPCPRERAIWGHAVVAVGFDEGMEITNRRCPSTKTKGAFLIRNSWGTAWGDKGYGWLPYDYVLKGLALDFWSLLSAGWVDTGEFGLR